MFDFLACQVSEAEIYKTAERFQETGEVKTYNYTFFTHQDLVSLASQVLPRNSLEILNPGAINPWVPGPIRAPNLKRFGGKA